MLKPVYALVGPDVFLQLEKLRELLRAAPADTERIDVDGETAELAEVLDDLRSFAMFGSGKLVVVRSADVFITRFRSQLERFLEEGSSTGTLVLRTASLPANQRIHRLIAKIGEVCKCEPPKGRQGLATWATRRAKDQHKLILRPDAAQLLADLIGADLGRIDNELAKLSLSASAPVDAQAVRGSVSFQREQEMWDMTNLVSVGQITESLRRWRQLVQMDSSAEYRAVTWLTMWLEKVRKALELLRIGRPARSIPSEINVFPPDLHVGFMRTAEVLGEDGTAKLFDLLAETDRQSKSGIGQMAENVERFLLTVHASLGQAAGRGGPMQPLRH